LHVVERLAHSQRTAASPIYAVTGGAQMRANLKLVKPSPTPVNGTVPSKRVCNADVRPREYLTPKEVEKLIKTARARGRYGAHDGLAVLMAYQHG
jgi:type 1 fimbriae regulatory protein FimB/type 1 fimbriae regulatory protein FimE